MSTLQAIALVELVVCWIAWALAFLSARKTAAGQAKVVRARVSNGGVALQMLGFAMVCFYVPSHAFQKSWVSLIVSMIFGPLAVVLGWSAVRHLGKHWRFEAALSENHTLVQTGPYRLIRHPIYASMLCMYIAIGAAWAWWPMFALGFIPFLIGTEIRVRSEDRLLGDRFEKQFSDYRSRVYGYVPFVW